MRLVFFIALVAAALCARLSPKLLSDLLHHNGKSSFYIHMKARPDVDALAHPLTGEPVANIADHSVRGRLVFNYLIEFAEDSQAEIVAYLQAHHVKFSVLWITNSILVEGNSNYALIDFLRRRDDVDELVLDVPADVNDMPQPLGVPEPFAAVEDMQWNVKYINADKLHKMGVTGKGITLSVSDTGVDYKHEIINAQYKGNKGSGKYDHNYNWFDPSPSNSSEPKDSHSHGTHCMGIACGRKGIGIAPDAQWIACRGIASSRGSDIVKCFQFLLAPFDLAGKNPNPDLRPHVSSHSYYCVDCRLHDAIKALHKAGVMVVKSAGNQGPRCSSITLPGIYKEVFAIGALSEKSDKITSFSSRGPTKEEKLVKPDFVCPGEKIYSSVPGNRYSKMSGTSMAAPSFNGAVSLLWSAFPKLARNIEGTREIFRKSAFRLESKDCSSSGIPNNVYGYGKIDLEKAYKEAQALYGN